MLYCLGVDNIKFDIIFTTAHSEYGYEAFKFSALHYLKKPISQEDLSEAIGRITLRRKNSISVADHIKTLESYPRKIALPTKKGYVFKDTDEILYCKADGNFTYVYFFDQMKLHITRSLKRMNEILEKHHFRRVHHQYIVNVNHLKRFDSKENYLFLKDDTSIPVSRAKRSIFLRDLS